MPRLSAVNPATASGKSKDLLAAVQSKLGVTPNLFRVLANSPAALEGALGLSGALAGGSLDAKMRERIALAVAETNACDYCASAHTLLGKRAGLSDADVAAAREGRGADARSTAATRFAILLVKNQGRATDTDVARLREAGFSDGEIAEIIANVALNILTNYVNHVAQTDIDFPLVRTGKSLAA